MSLIPYPDVPPLPGVPPLPRLPASGTIQPSTALAQPTQATPGYSAAITPWQITNAAGIPLLIPDTVLEFEYRGEMKIPTYPIENGGFKSYNKVYVPFDARLTCACNGNGAMTREQFLNAVESLRSGIEALVPVFIMTPDEIYSPCSLIHVDYRRHARAGVSMIAVQLWFHEIRAYGVTAKTTAAPSGADPQPAGQVAPVSPSAQQQSSYNATPINGGATGIYTSGVATGAY